MPNKAIFDFRTLAGPLRYKLLTGLVIPRPIALVTSLSREGVLNAAPFSFFNVFSEDPAVVVLGLEARPDGSMKDTARNVREMGAFAVNLVDEALAVAMNDCAVDFPPETSEPGTLGLALAEGVTVPVPHLAEAPAVLECRKMMILNVGRTRDLLIGEIVGIQTRPGVVDPDTLRINLDVYKPVGRLFGPLYARQNDRFALKRETLAEWTERQAAAGGD